MGKEISTEIELSAAVTDYWVDHIATHLDWQTRLPPERPMQEFRSRALLISPPWPLPQVAVRILPARTGFEHVKLNPCASTPRRAVKAVAKAAMKVVRRIS